MNILFIHQNFPGQFKHLAPALARHGHTVVAMTMQKTAAKEWQGVKLVPYSANRSTTPNVHPWVSDFETKTIRGEACFRAALQLKARGFTPDVIIAHPGWGESLFVKEVWPQAKLGIYCEFFYHPHGADVGFDPEFPTQDPEGQACRLRLKNLNNPKQTKEHPLTFLLYVTPHSDATPPLGTPGRHRGRTFSRSRSTSYPTPPQVRR